MEELITAYILVKGNVQGVGFRYHTTRLAESLGLDGYVRNLVDGDVEIEVEGDKLTVDKFLENLKEGTMHSYIDSFRVEWCEYKHNYNRFNIRF